MPSDLLKESLRNMLKDESFLKLWSRQGAEEKKKILLSVETEGEKDIEHLIAALDRASGSTRKFVGDLGKYQSAISAVSQAYKEGYSSMRDYLEQAGASGGKIAVVGAALSFVTKQLKEQIDQVKDYVNATAKYNIQQEKFSRVSHASRDAIKSFRAELSLAKDEMGAFFAELKRGEQLGISGNQIKQIYTALKETYGATEALEMLKSYQEILSKLPSYTDRLKSGKGGFSEGDIYNLLESGNFTKMIELRGAGLFGGDKGKASEAAAIENAQKNTAVLAERAKDWGSEYFSPMLGSFSVMTGELTNILGAVINLAGVMGSLRALGVMMRMTGVTGAAAVGGKMAALGGMAKAGGVFAAKGIGILGAGALLGQGVAGGISKMSGGVTYSPQEMWDAMRSGHFGGALKRNLTSWKGFTGDSSFNEEDEFTDDMRQTMKMNFNPYKHTQSGRRRTEAEQKRMHRSDITIGNIFEATKMFEDRWLHWVEALKEMGATVQDMGELTGDIDMVFSGIEQVFTATRDNAQEAINKYDSQIEKINQEIEMMSEKDPDYRTSDSYKTARAALTYQQKQKMKVELDLINADMEKRRREADALVSAGGLGFQGSATLGLSQARAGTALARSAMTGGEVEAARRSRGINILAAQNTLAGIDNAIAAEERTLSAETDPEKRMRTEKLLAKYENDRASAMEALAKAFQDMPDLDRKAQALEIYGNLLARQTEYVTALSNSYSELRPFWEEEVKVKQREAAIAKERLDRAGDDGIQKGTLIYKQLEVDSAMKALDARQAEYDLAVKTRDKRQEEVNFESDWMNEQANFIEEMGGHFSDVLSMRMKSLDKSREAIAAQSDYLKVAKEKGLDDFSLLKEEVALERMKMQLTKDTVGVQRSAYEKFVGMAFGALGDVGFKRGRMDDAILMGKENTRVRDRAGMYHREKDGRTPDLTRDQLSGLMAAGELNTGGSKTRTQDYFNSMRVASSDAKPEVQVNGSVKLDLSPDLIVRTQQWAFRLSGNKEFGTALVNANSIITKQHRVSGADQ